MYNLPKSGIFVFVNEKSKSVYISYSKNLILTLARNVKEIQDRVHIYKPLNSNLEDWEFSIIETIHYEDSLLDIHCKVNFYVNEYRNNGYDVKHHNIMVLQFRVEIGSDYRIYCKLKARNGNEYIVGVFRNRLECSYLDDIYRNMKTIIPVYACNELSREYFVNLAC